MQKYYTKLRNFIVWTIFLVYTISADSHVKIFGFWQNDFEATKSFSNFEFEQNNPEIIIEHAKQGIKSLFFVLPTFFKSVNDDLYLRDDWE